MGQEEIEFETIGSDRWGLVKEGAHGKARERIQNRYDDVLNGVSKFKSDASELITNSIRKPPEDVSILGAIVDVVLLASTLVVPEVGVAAEIVEAVKESYEVWKSSSEVADKIRQQMRAATVDDAVKQLNEIANAMASDVEDAATRIRDNVQESVGAALDSYVTQNPQVFRVGDDAFYGELCDAIGITHPDSADVVMAVWEKMFKPFREKVLEMAAALHFFTEMENDAERLDFLMDEADKDNDPDALLDLIGGDRAYWDQFLAVYKADGRAAAQFALTRHLTGM